MDEYELEERRKAFLAWFHMNAQRLGYNSLPVSTHGTVHELIKRAFYAGVLHERRQHEPVTIGGRD